MIVGIYIHEKEREPTQRKSAVQCEAGYGIEGDFYHTRAKAKGEPAPGRPPAKRAACRPDFTPRPPPSTPTRRTLLSAAKAEKMPIELEPPPTQAATS